jgi:hypothetical protein
MSTFEYINKYYDVDDMDKKKLSSSVLDQFHRSHTSEEYKGMVDELFNVFGLHLSRSNDSHKRRIEF